MKEIIRNNPEAMERIRLAESFPLRKTKIILTKEKPWTEIAIEKGENESEFNGNDTESDKDIKQKGMAAFSC